MYNNDRKIIEKSKETFKKCLEISKKKIKVRKLGKDRSGFTRNKETIEIGINSTELSSMIKKLIQDQLNKPTANFIKGLFDAEGSIDLAGNVTLWQRKNTQGTKVIKTIKKFLSENKIKNNLIKNKKFHILEIPGRYKNYKNMKKFEELIGFTSPSKQKDINLILNIFSKKTKTDENKILEFVFKNKQVTLREVIEEFKIPKINAYRALNKLVEKGKLEKVNSYPNIYRSYWHPTKR